MQVYLDLAVLLNFAVDFFLLMGANRLCGYNTSPGRCALGALLGGIYAGTCLLPGFRFLGNGLWRTVSLLLMGMAAYGIHRSAVPRSIVFVILCMALGGLASMAEKGSFWGLLMASGALLGLCLFGFREKIGAQRYVPVELYWAGKRVKLTALRDTGNTLKDPVTGMDVLVIGPQAAHTITGLTDHQLRHPVESVGTIPGLRLVPYHSVGQTSGLLLAMRLPRVKIGKRCDSRLVAFAPNNLSTDNRFQALTGGNI